MKFRTSVRFGSMLLCGASLCAVSLFSLRVAAADKVTFDIKPQPLSSALDAFGVQAHRQILFTPALTADKTTDGISGALDTDVALAELLAGTGLTFNDANGTILIVQGTAGGGEPPGGGSEEPRPNRLGVASQASPSEASGTGPAPEEIIVTAQKREERLKDVPMSISVLSGGQLDQSTSQGITEALRGLPGVVANVNVFGGSTNVSLRGVAASGPLYFSSSPVSFYVDSVPFGLVKSAIAPDANAYDLDRIEILRGPQGTLYGASAQAGVVRILTKEPDLGAFDLKARSSVSGTEHGGVNTRIDVALNVPLISDVVAARAVIGYENLSGWIDRPDKKGANDASLLNARLKVKAQPIDPLTLELSTWISHDDYGALSYSPNNRTIDFHNDEPSATHFNFYGFKASYDFSVMTITATSSYITYKNPFDWELAPHNILYTLNASQVFTQEVYLSSRDDGQWHWTAGASYRTGKDRLYQTIPVYDYLGDFTDESDSYAIFGELSRDFLDRQFELTAGFRYFDDSVTQGENVSDTVPPTTLYRRGASFDKVSPRVVLKWRPDDDVMFYTSYSEGFRSGSNQEADVARLAPNYPPVRPDNLKNYEIGAKGSLWGRRVDFDVAAYFMDWENVQELLTIPEPNIPNVNTAVLVNGKSASGPGLDLALTVHPAEDLTLGLNFGWNGLTEDADVLAFPKGAPQGVVVYPKGSRRNLSPETTVRASVDYIVARWGAGYEARASSSFSYVSGQYYKRLVATHVDVTPGQSLLIGRVSAILDSPDRWSATLYIDNVNNEQNSVFLHWTDVPERNLHIRPRTFGVQFEYRY